MRGGDEEFTPYHRTDLIQSLWLDELFSPECSRPRRRRFGSRLWLIRSLKANLSRIEASIAETDEDGNWSFPRPARVQQSQRRRATPALF